MGSRNSAPGSDKGLHGPIEKHAGGVEVASELQAHAVAKAYPVAGQGRDRPTGVHDPGQGRVTPSQGLVKASQQEAKKTTSSPPTSPWNQQSRSVSRHRTRTCRRHPRHPPPGSGESPVLSDSGPSRPAPRPTSSRPKASWKPRNAPGVSPRREAISARTWRTAGMASQHRHGQNVHGPGHDPQGATGKIAEDEAGEKRESRSWPPRADGAATRSADRPALQTARREGGAASRPPRPRNVGELLLKERPQEMVI